MTRSSGFLEGLVFDSSHCRGLSVSVRTDPLPLYIMQGRVRHVIWHSDIGRL